MLPKPMIQTAIIFVALLLGGLECALGDSANGSVSELREDTPLSDYFPYGFWMADGGFNVRTANALEEPYFARLEKIIHDLARHHVNAVIPANRSLTLEHLDMAQRYGMRIATMPNLLEHHIKRDGSLVSGPAAKDMAWVKGTFEAHARQIKNHPGFLAYHLYDEPGVGGQLPKIRELADFLRRVDPVHPAIYTHQNLPLNKKRSVEWGLVASQKVILSDWYTMNGVWGRDPWRYGDAGMPEYQRANSRAWHWPIIQSFPYGQMPTIPELRVMIYHTIARGAKGMFFFTTGQSYISWSWLKEKGLPGFYPAPGNAWFAEDPMLREIGRIGEHLTTAGPLLIKLQYRGDYPVYVEGQRFQARVQPRLRKLDFIDRTAVEAGAFVGSDFDVLVVHNDDPWRTQEARVTIKKSSREHVKYVYDLLTLKPIDVSDAEDYIAFDVSFAPGDGRLYLIGDDQAFRKASRTVLRNRCKHQLMLIERDLDITRRGGVNVTPIEVRINEVLAMADANDFADALAELEAARHDLVKAEEGEPVYAAIRGDIEQIRCDFIDTHNWLVDHGDLFQPGAGGDPALRGLCERVIKLTMQFGALENAFRTGELRPAEAASLRKIVREIKTKVLSYRPPKLIDRSIAVVQMGKPTPDDDSLYDWLRMTYTQVDRVWPDGKADFVDGDGGPISLSDYEMLWVHLSGLSSAVQSRYCVTADVDLNSLPPEAVSAVKRFVDQGGGLVLSGMAACLVKPLGLDSTMPNEVYWGTMYVPGDAPMKWERWNNCGKVLGLKPMVAGHPVFKTLPAQGFGVWDYDESELLSKAVWCRRPPKKNSVEPAWPNSGTVLAGYYSDGAEIPDDFAVIVEYTGNEGGKIVVVGDGIDPDPGRRIDPRFSAKIQNSNRDKLIRNIVDYCSGG